MINLSDHAKKMWDLRFSEYDLEFEYRLTKRVGRSIRKKIRKQCPYNSDLKRLGLNLDRYYCISPNNIIFIIGYDQTIITVFPYSHGNK